MILTLQGWATHSRNTVDLGSVPQNRYLVRSHVQVTEAFNSDGSDTLTVGTETDPDRFVTSIDVSTTGIKSVTLGIGAGYNDPSPISIFYTAGGSAPTAGKALVVLEFFPVPTQPA